MRPLRLYTPSAAASAAAPMALPSQRRHRMHSAASRSRAVVASRAFRALPRTTTTASAFPLTSTTTASAPPSSGTRDRIPGDDMFMPTREQRTLAASFTIGGIGLHTGEYAYVRVRPAHAGEGRYFVLVPPGTNADTFVPNMRAGGGTGREEAAANAAAAAAADTTAAEAAAAEASEATSADEGSDADEASASAAAAAAASKAAAAAALSAASSSSSSSSTAAPGSETSPRDARRYLSYLRALDRGYRGEYGEWLIDSSLAEKASSEVSASALGVSGIAASLLTTTPAAAAGRDDVAASAPAGGEIPIPKSSSGAAASVVDATPGNAFSWAAGRCLALEGRGDDVAFLNVGPLLAALEGMGVSCARIEVEAAASAPGAAPFPRGDGEREQQTGENRTRVELPVTDGSALQWSAEIARTGLVPATPPSSSSSSPGAAPPSTAPAPRRAITVDGRSGSGSNNNSDGFISLYPGAAASSPSSPGSTPSRLSVGVDAGPLAPVVGSQWLSWRPESAVGVGPQGAGHFRWSVAPARDWVPSSDYLLDSRAKHGLYRGGTLGTTLVARGSEWAEPHRCRFVPDEPARNAAAAAVGALALLSGGGGVGIPRGGAHVVAFNADAEMWVEFVRALEAEGAERVALE